MKVTRLLAKNFRRHINISMPFEMDTTVLVGENDAGKTTVIDILKIMLSEEAITVDDFNIITNPLELELSFDNSRSIRIISSIVDGKVAQRRYITYDGRYIASLRSSLVDFDEAETKAVCKRFNIPVGSSKIDTLKQKLIDTLSDRNNFEDGKFIVEVGKFSEDIKVYFLDGKSFEDVNKFVHDTFFKGFQKTIWDEPLDPDGPNMSLHQYMEGRITSIREKVQSDIDTHDLVQKLQRYIPDVTGISLVTDFERRDINLAVKVMFIVNSTEREARKFGDGTRRRVTLALLQHKIENETEEALYILDEPDTHLHPRAQGELLDIIDDIAAGGNQIIISTHSPFLMNSAYIRQIRMLEKYKTGSLVKRLSDDKARLDGMQSLGIENSHIFFSKKIVIVEGKTEQTFFPAAYEKMYSRPMSRDFIRLIPREGIKDAVRFAEVIQSFLGHASIYLITDNDASEELQQIITTLNIPQVNQFKLGRREFEDAFSSHVIHESWCSYVASKRRQVGENWTSDNIFALLQESGDSVGKAKFSERLSELNKGCLEGLTKPKLGDALGRFCETQHLPPYVIEFLGRVHEE